MTNLLAITMAYQYVMLALLNAEADLAVARIGVASMKPMQFEEMRMCSIAPPEFWQGGGFDTDHLFWGITDSSRNLVTVDEEMDSDLFRRGRIWEKMPSLVDSNGAVTLATQWLQKLEVNVTNLNRTCQMKVEQEYLLDGPVKRMLPRYEVEWYDARGKQVMQVSVFGPDKSPLYIRIKDLSFSGRPKLLVKEPEKLLAIPNDLFLKMPDDERQKLVLTHASTNYPSLRFPPRDWFDRRFTPRVIAPRAPP